MEILEDEEEKENTTAPYIMTLALCIMLTPPTALVVGYLLMAILHPGLKLWPFG